MTLADVSREQKTTSYKYPTCLVYCGKWWCWWEDILCGQVFLINLIYAKCWVSQMRKQLLSFLICKILCRETWQMLSMDLLCYIKKIWPYFSENVQHCCFISPYEFHWSILTECKKSHQQMTLQLPNRYKGIFKSVFLICVSESCKASLYGPFHCDHSHPDRLVYLACLKTLAPFGTAASYFWIIRTYWYKKKQYGEYRFCIFPVLIFSHNDKNKSLININLITFRKPFVEQSWFLICASLSHSICIQK